MATLMDAYQSAVKGAQDIQQKQFEIDAYKKQLADQAEAEKTYAEAQKTQPTMVGGYQDQKGPPSLAQNILPGESGGMPKQATAPMGGAPMPSFMGGAGAEAAAKEPTKETPATPMERLKTSKNEVEGLQGVLQRNTNAIKLANSKGNYKLANALALQNEEIQNKHAKAQIDLLSNAQTTLELGGQLVRGYEADLKSNPSDANGAWARFVLSAQSNLGVTGDQLLQARTPQERQALVEQMKGSADKNTEVLKAQKMQLEFEAKQAETQRKTERAQELNDLAERKLQLQKDGMEDKANLIQAKIDQLKILGELEQAKTEQAKAKKGGVGPTAFLKNTIGDSSGDAKIDQNITNTGGAIVAADHLIDRLKDPEILTGAQLSLKTIQNRIKGLSENKEITDDDIKNFVEGSVEPTAKNAAFRKEALYTAFEIEKEAQGGRLTVAMMKQGGSALDPTKYTKEGYGTVLATRRKELYRKLEGWNLDDDQKQKLVNKLSEKAPPMKTTETPSVTSKQQYDALPSGAIYIEDGKKYRKP